MATRIMVLLAVAFACGYGTKQLIGGFKRDYFNVSLCGMAALLFARIYYLVILLSEGNDEIFTVGVLGQASAYLFFMTANISFLSRDIIKKAKKKICIPGAVGVVLIAVLYIVAAARTGTISAYIGDIIYIFSMCGAFYFSANAASYHKENAACASVYHFNICVCILTVLNAFYEFVPAVATETGSKMIMWVLTVMCSFILVVMFPMLRRGMSK